MIKIFFTSRNRLAITCKAITALKKHSKLPHQLYVYDNLTSHKINEHFMYWCMLYKADLITQVSFTTKDSTFNAFSKAVASNLFFLQHSQDPQKNNYDFLVCIDNDIIVCDGWDIKLKNAWDDVKKLGMKNIKIIGQTPGGIKNKKELPMKIGGMHATTGKLGGSGFWSFQPDFYKEVGLLDVSKLVGHDKKHDQYYWQLLEKSTQGQDYILGLREKLCYHVGGIAGSICNILTKNHLNKNKLSMINLDEADKKIDAMSFDEFFSYISSNKNVLNDW
jgi:hypothetical protein